MGAPSPLGSYVVSPVSPEDLEEIASIEATLFGDPWSMAGFSGALGSHGAYVRCARQHGEGMILGYVVAWFVADEGQIANLAVRREVQGRGVGAALLDGMIDEARVRSVATVYLEVRASNVAALALYRGRGFEEIGRRRGYYRAPVEDAMILRLSISHVMQ